MTQTYIDAERYTPYMNIVLHVYQCCLTGSPKACRVYKTVYDERKCKTSSN